MLSATPGLPASGRPCVLAVALVLVWKRTQLLATEAARSALSTPATVVAKPQTASGGYYVSGEVRSPNRQAYDSRVTVPQAIAAAGDFTDFGDKERVKLTHANGRLEILNCLKAQEDP